MRTIRWDDGSVITIDQSRLPERLVFLRLKTCGEIAEVIKEMKIRGAPLIGVAAAFGLALTAYHSRSRSREGLLKELEEAAALLKSTRPTGVNLFWAVDRVLKSVRETCFSGRDVAKVALEEAFRIAEEDVQVNKAIGRNGTLLLEDNDTVLTHCNAGALGTVEYGTALGVVRAAIEDGKKLRVIATETRPKLQGARLTTFELKQDNIPTILISDTMVGYVMQRGIVNKVIVGADRILRTGHVINKIGTYSIAVLAKVHNIPFYVAAPSSTVDLKTNVDDVVIEHRDPEEVLTFLGRRIAPLGIDALNPAFDITPPEYVTTIITEMGCIKPKEVAIKSCNS